jgi:hypothetical protein
MPTLESLDLQKVARDLMLSQFKDKPVINGLLDSWTKPLQEFEETIKYLIDNGGISNARGPLLDMIGSWMGVERNGRPDPSYRTAILGRAVGSDMDGTTEKFLQGLRTLANTNDVTFFEAYPATIYPVLGSGWVAGIVSEIQRIRMAGVECRVLLSSDLEYQEFGEVGDESNLIYTNTEDSYQVVVDGLEYDLAVSVVQSAEVYGTSTICGEGGVEMNNAFPMADVMLTDVKIEAGLLVDNNGNQIVDELGNPISVIEYFI